MDSKLLSEIGESVRSLRYQMRAEHTVKGRKTIFDGTNADMFGQWILEGDDMFETLNQDDSQTLWAASQLLKGSALDYYRQNRRLFPTWEQFKTAMIERYSYLNPAARSKQKLRQAIQNNNENVTEFAERIKSLAQQAYANKLAETEVIEIITNSFINGLKDRRLQESVARKMPKSLQEAHDAAVHEQRIREHLRFFKDNTPSAEPMDCDTINKSSSDLTR